MYMIQEQQPAAKKVETSIQGNNPNSEVLNPEVKSLLDDEKFLVVKDDEHVKAYEAYKRKQEDEQEFQAGLQTQDNLESVREKENRIKAESEAVVSQIFTRRNEQSRDRDASGKKIDLVKAVITLFKNSVMKEGQSVTDWNKYQAAVMEKASMISDPNERQALEALVNNQGNGALNALARGPITQEQRSSAERKMVESGLSTEEARTKLDNLQAARDRNLADAKKILDAIDPDLSYNL